MATQHAQFEIRRSDDRGTTELGWLHSRHSFSFGSDIDRDRITHGALRVLNGDIVEPDGGFGTHPHQDMEIITWVLEGGLAHTDSTGTRGEIRPGDLQVMSAGSGLTHSEMNASDSEQVHFLQIWIEPSRLGVEPRHGQTTFAPLGRRDRWQRDRWQMVASPDGRDGSLLIHQDALLRISEPGPGARLVAPLDAGRLGYMHVPRGTVRAGDETLHDGGAVTWSGAGSIEIVASDQAQLLFFDLG